MFNNRKYFRKKFIVIFTLFFGLSFTLLLAYIAFNESHKTVEDDIENKFINVRDNVSRNINSIEEVAYSLRTFFYASDLVSSDNFRLMSQDILTRHKYISSISYLEKVKNSDRFDFEYRMVDEGFINFSLKEKNNFSYAIASSRDVYYPLIYIEPFSPLNAKKIGYDYFSNSQYTASIDAAIKRGTLEASADAPNSYVVFIAIYAGNITPETLHERNNTVIGLVSMHINKLLLPSILPDVDIELNIFNENENQIDSLLKFLGKNDHSQDAWVFRNNSKDYRISSEHQVFQLKLNKAVLWTDLEYRYFLMAIFIGLFLSGVAAFQVGLIIRQNERLFYQKNKMQKLNVDLQLAQVRAEESNRLKSEFLSNMSHELRTPLHSVIGFCELGEACLSGWSVDEQIENLQEIYGSGQQLLSLIDDLLDLSSLEAGRYEMVLNKVSLLELSHSAVESMDSRIKEKNLAVTVEGVDELIECDEQRILQVISNLLANAIEFTSTNKQISLYVEKFDVKKNDRFQTSFSKKSLVFSIADQGVGVPEDERLAIFDRFIQSSKTMTGSGGTGLGLAVCKGIINAHHGVIWMENGQTGGAKFSFILPGE